jgi:hypothetical protein
MINPIELLEVAEPYDFDREEFDKAATITAFEIGRLLQRLTNEFGTVNSKEFARTMSRILAEEGKTNARN